MMTKMGNNFKMIIAKLILQRVSLVFFKLLFYK